MGQVAGKIATNFRLSEEAHSLLGQLAEDAGLSRTAYLETLIRRAAEARGFRAAGARKNSRKKSGEGA